MDKIISHIHLLLHNEINELNNILIKNLATNEETIELVSKYLMNAGGKRIRPILTILSGKIFGNNSAELLSLAAAVELIHGATLLHDDVIDNSKMRRFKPTANTIWGNKTSILIGDFLFSQSFKLMVSSNSLSALRSLSSASSTIIEGELMQLVKLNQRRMITNDEYENVVKAKTAELFGVACEVGAIISNQTVATSALMKKFGFTLGYIFQIIDDLLDYFGEENKIGKNIGDDFKEGKVTLPLIFLHERLYPEHKEKLSNLLTSDNNDADFHWVQNLMKENGIDLIIKNKVTSLSNDIKYILQEIDGEDVYKNELNNLIDFAINRSF